MQYYYTLAEVSQAWDNKTHVGNFDGKANIITYNILEPSGMIDSEIMEIVTGSGAGYVVEFADNTWDEYAGFVTVVVTVVER
jgi:hypothetical protein